MLFKHGRDVFYRIIFNKKKNKLPRNRWLQSRQKFILTYLLTFRLYGYILHCKDLAIYAGSQSPYLGIFGLQNQNCGISDPFKFSATKVVIYNVSKNNKTLL